MIVECSDIPEELLKDTNLLSLAQWLREGGLWENWTEETEPCPKCEASAYHIIGTNESFLVCPQCMGHDKHPRSTEASPASRLSWAKRVSTKPSSPPGIPPTYQWTSQSTTQCRIVCPKHDAPCDLRKEHLRRHHHTSLNGSFCFFDYDIKFDHRQLFLSKKSFGPLLENKFKYPFHHFQIQVSNLQKSE